MTIIHFSTITQVNVESAVFSRIIASRVYTITRVVTVRTIQQISELSDDSFTALAEVQANIKGLHETN